ncbi:MAG: hypothetical protein PUP91_34435 [Rhizonema sp. PD37]|nr:hypothetical protein [Rhizonema sp. PD37]
MTHLTVKERVSALVYNQCAIAEAPVSAGSKTTSSVGSAVYAATTSLMSKLLNLAFKNPNSPLYGHDEYEQVEGRVIDT